jgi:hypothetical protein
MKRLLITVLGGSIFFTSCQPKPSGSDLVKNMLVYTANYDQTTDYSKYNTYSLALDTLSYFNNQDSNEKDTLQCSACTGNNNALDIYPSIVTEEIKLKLDGGGFTHVSAKANPDLKVYVVIVENYNVYQSLSYYPYGYGYGGYYGGYGYYGGGYVPTVSETDQADLYIQIFDMKNRTNGKPTPLWGCDISDLVSSNDLGNLTIKAVDQAFAQSSYIKK